ncbi:hypothetical protein BDR07DRAFT_869301 [Suillus spraguei]|nr:hypothetical protein BDR07DRAFT_869301 [Suillus spraguei]
MRPLLTSRWAKPRSRRAKLHFRRAKLHFRRAKPRSQAALQADQANLRQGIEEIRNEQEHARQEADELRGEVQNIGRIITEMDQMFILRMKNLSLSWAAALTWPPGVVANLPAGYPTTPRGLLEMTIPMCDSISTALGLPAFPPRTPVMQRRERLMIHLGCLQLGPEIRANGLYH